VAYNLAKFRELIRLTLDLDATDLPNTLVDEWVRDGATRAQTRRQEWPFFQYDWTFTGSKGVSNYTFTFIEDGGAEKIAEIRQVRGPSWDLRWQDIATRDRYRSRDSDTSGSPSYWSVWNNGELVLDPAPDNSTDTFVIRGYKKPKDWVAAVDPGDQVSDMPAEFDSPILNWALGRAYAQQDEPQTALYYADLADLRLRELVKFYDDPSPAISVTMGGDYNRNMYPLMDPRFAWE
jgi:hypothetical protein